MTRVARLSPLLLFLGLTLAYNANGTVLLGNDTRPARYTAVSLLKRGDLDLDEFAAQLRGPRPGAWPYFVAPARGGHIVSRFGFGAPLVAAPVFAVGLVAHGGKLRERTALYLAKLAASLCVAAAAALVLLAGRRLGSPRAAWAAALLFGLGTCAASVASQALWQHGPAMLFLALGAYLLVRDGPRAVPWSGAAFAALVVCRPPDACFAVAALGYVAVARRRALPGFLLAAAPLALAQLAYNAHYFGGPLAFSQAAPTPGELPAATSFWGTAFAEGLAGLLLSPSRGLLVYTPAFLFLLAPSLWRGQAPPLRWLLGGAAALLLVQAFYHRWWGGWSFGYRLLADAAVVLCLALVPVLTRLSRRGAALFGALAAASLAIHVAGAVCYDPTRWDMRVDVDAHPERLWSVRDSQLVDLFADLRPRARP